MNTAPARLRIAVLDDHWMSRKVLADLVAEWPQGEVVLQATNGFDYQGRLKDEGPIDLAIVDLFMPLMDGFETIAWIREHQPETRILAITFDPKDEYVHGALLAGAHGIVGKACERQELHAALEALRTTGRYANDLLMRQVTHVPDPNSPWVLKKKLEQELSPRELEFGKRYVSDASPSRVTIAKAMAISAHTAESYRRNLVEKTGANTRVALLKCFLRFGVVKL
ncbi:MAG: response regulator transcription factor [Flavobacteriales bacterium]|nr:response regulator transcription factor [Flavobacteriales bacterium]